MEENTTTFLALEKAIQDGKIKKINIRTTADRSLLIVEITGSELPLPSSATAVFPQKNIVRYAVAAALNQLGICTPDAENAVGKVLPSYGEIPFWETVLEQANPDIPGFLINQKILLL